MLSSVGCVKTLVMKAGDGSIFMEGEEVLVLVGDFVPSETELRFGRPLAVVVVAVGESVDEAVDCCAALSD